MNTRSTELFDVDAIRITDRARKLDEQSVTRIQESIQKIGLRTPITIRMVDPDGISDAVLVTGLHRLEAVKRLGWQQIECFVAEHDDEDRARMWEIAENLHRAELTALDRSEHIAEWVRLAEKVAQDAPVLGGRGNEGGLRKASRDLGIDRDDARRSVKVDKLTPEAKEAARAVGLDDNRKALLEASMEAPERQAARISEIAAAKAQKPPKLAADPLDDTLAEERQVARLMDAWNAAGMNARDEFLLRIGAVGGRSAA